MKQTIESFVLHTRIDAELHLCKSYHPTASLRTDGKMKSRTPNTIGTPHTIHHKSHNCERKMNGSECSASGGVEQRQEEGEGEGKRSPLLRAAYQEKELLFRKHLRLFADEKCVLVFMKRRMCWWERILWRCFRRQIAVTVNGFIHFILIHLLVRRSFPLLFFSNHGLEELPSVCIIFTAVG